jgi:hypothetical protein
LCSWWLATTAGGSTVSSCSWAALPKALPALRNLELNQPKEAPEAGALTVFCAPTPSPVHVVYSQASEQVQAVVREVQAQQDADSNTILVIV